MSRGLKALEVLLEVADGYEHSWEEIHNASHTIKLELKWLDSYSEQLAKREEQLDKIKEIVNKYGTKNGKIATMIRNILEEE